MWCPDEMDRWMYVCELIIMGQDKKESFGKDITAAV